MSDHPDFSGVWRADFKRSRLEIEAPDSSVFRVRHEDPEFVMTRTHAAGGREDTFSVRLTTDGQEHVHHKGDLEIQSRCAWDADGLLFTSTILFGGSEAKNVVRYALSGDGRELWADETYTGPPKSYHNVWVMVRE